MVVLDPQPVIGGQVTFTITENNVESRETRVYNGDIPEEIMSEYKQLIGDGKAEVSVHVDIGEKNFGNGTSASVSIKLTCDQSEQIVHRTYQIASYLARTWAKEQQAGAQQEFVMTHGERT